MNDLFGAIQPITSQPSFAFPASLTAKYRPLAIADFIGLDKPKKIARVIATSPAFDNGWLFIGPAGTGKTSLALAIAAMMPAEIHHIPSQECNLDRLQRVATTCQYVPMSGCKTHLILVDEADRMSEAAQMFCLSKLDGTAKLPNTVWIFTCNDDSRFEDRFLSRNQKVEFSTYGIAKDAAELLEKVWNSEAPAGATSPNFARIVKESNNNVREALMRLQTEICLASAV